MTLLAGVLLASLLGSVHCGAMCGAFACLANTRGAGGSPWYHSGRLAAYLGLGAMAGALGIGLDALGALQGVQRGAALVTSVALVAWGLWQLSSALRPAQHATATQWGGTLGRLLQRTAHWDPRARALSIGLVTGLMPCGWLWAFVATAMGTGSAFRGAAVMAVFWTGTVPMLLAVAAGARRLGPLARVRWPVASASLVLLLGAGELIAHLRMPVMPMPGQGETHTHMGAH